MVSDTIQALADVARDSTDHSGRLRFERVQTKSAVASDAGRQIGDHAMCIGVDNTEPFSASKDEHMLLRETSPTKQLDMIFLKHGQCCQHMIPSAADCPTPWHDAMLAERHLHTFELYVRVYTTRKISVKIPMRMQCVVATLSPHENRARPSCSPTAKQMPVRGVFPAVGMRCALVKMFNPTALSAGTNACH